MRNKSETKFQHKKLDPRTKKRRKQEVIKNIPPQDGLRTENENGVVDVYVETIDEAGENEEDTVNAAETLSASARKLRNCGSSERGTSRTNDEDTSSTSTTSFVNNNINGYVLFDIMIFINMIKELVKCMQCVSSVIIEQNVDDKMGLCNFFTIKCNHHECPWTKKVATSNFIDKHTGSGKVPYDVNLRTVVAFREIAIETFCGFMNMPPPMISKTYQETMECVHPFYIEAATMKAASDEIREELLGDNFDEDTVVDVDISADGSWQKRSFSSLNGFTTIISLLTGKCLSYDAMAKKCKAYESWESKKDTAEYHRFVETHECSINHLGSAGLMEPSGVVRCFKRSVETLKLRYDNFIADGDSEAFLEVAKADPYDGFPVKKGECIGHIQKRVGSRLRKLKKEYVSKKLKDGKTLRGRLADKDINRLPKLFWYCDSYQSLSGSNAKNL